MPWAMAMAGTFLPWPKTLPGSLPTAMVVAVRAAGGVAEQRMDPGNLPGGFRVRGREHLEAAGGVGRHQLAGAGGHRRVDRVARAERLAATLAGAMAGVQRVGPRRVGLDAALLRFEQAVADGEGAGLVELDGLEGHVRLLSDLRRDDAEVAQQVF